MPTTARTHVSRITSSLLFALLCAGCGARYVRMDEKGLTCAEAHNLALQAVHRMNYAIDSSTKPSPGTPGVIVGSRTEGVERHNILVQVFCTTLGAQVEAKAEGGGLSDLNFAQEFRNSFGTLAAVRAPQRAAAESGLDVLVEPQRGSTSDLGVDVSDQGVLPVSVRITNRTPRAYRFRAQDVVLQASDGERIKPLAVQDVVAKLGAADAKTIREKLVSDRELQPQETLTGFLFFPFKSYVRARVALIDVASGEPEGFSIEF